MFYTEEMSSAAGATGEIVQEGFRVVGPQGQAVPEDVLEEAAPRGSTGSPDCGKGSKGVRT